VCLQQESKRKVEMWKPSVKELHRADILSRFQKPCTRAPLIIHISQIQLMRRKGGKGLAKKIICHPSPLQKK